MKTIQYWTYINTQLSKKIIVVYKITITAGLTSIRKVAALVSPKLNKDTLLSNNAVL